MFSSVFNFCYYATFVVVPVVLFLLVNDDEKFHSKGGLLYMVKFFFGRRAIKKAQKKIKTPKTYEEMDHYESPKPIKNETKTESISFNAVDQEGNQMSVKITLRADHVSEAEICLRIGTRVFTLPDFGGFERRHISGYQWRCQGLSVEVLEPFKRYRMVFNGFLRDVSLGNKGSVEHISFRLTWNCCSKPNISMVDEDLNLLAKCLAKTTWRDGNWLKLLGDEKSVTQLGALKGTIQGDNIPETHLNMPCLRKRTKGTSETEALDKCLTVFAATENGYLIHLGVKSLKNGCQELKFGQVLTHTGSVLPVKNCDLDLNKAERSISDKITIHVEVKTKMLKVVLSMNNNSVSEIVNDNFQGFKKRNVPAECTVNNFRGCAFLEYWTSHKGNGLKRPNPILRGIKLETIPDISVTPLGTEESKILELSGGKGHSLSLMKSLESDEISIPEGFIVTTRAFEKQIEFSFNLRKSVSLLEDIALGKEKGDLKDACKVTVDLIQSHTITPSVKQDIIDELMRFRRKHDDKIVPYLRWAVRSSAVGEDSEDFSNAGQNETFLGSQTDKDVLTKICKCWASLFTYQSVMYRKQHGIPIRSSMAVVIQKMIPADTSGVLFTCHPSTSDPSKMVITSNFGLGETVVSGEAEPDTITLSKTFEGNISMDFITLGSKTTSLIMGRFGLHKQTDDDKSGQLSLSQTHALKLGRAGIILEEAFGGPRDIEWAIFKDHLYILQSRPVTTLHQWTDQELTHEFDSPHVSNETFYTRANIGEVSPFALTALTFSTTLYCVDKGFQMSIFGKYDPYVSVNIRFSHHFCLIELLAGLYPRPSKEVSTFNSMVDLAIFGRPVLTPEMNRKAIARYGLQSSYMKLLELLTMVYSQLNAEKMVREIVEDEKNLLIRLEERDTAKEMYNKIDEAMPKLTRINQEHCQISGLSVAYLYIVFRQIMGGQDEIKMEHYNDLALILSACGDVVSAEIPSKLEEMAGILGNSELVQEFVMVKPEDGVEWLRRKCVTVYEMLDEFLEVHGHRLLGEMELSLKTWAMDPSTVIKMLQLICKFPTSKKTEKPVSEDVVDRLQSPMSKTTKTIVRFLIKRYRKTVGYRETSKSALIKATNKLRTAFRTLAREMETTGLIPDQDLIFHLTHYELWQTISRKNPSLITKASRRQRLYPSWNSLKFPEVMLEKPEPEVENEEESSEGSTEVVCGGTPVSVGEVKARAVVITSLDQVEQLRQGDILITRSTDIGWSPYFPMLAGVVTELGGLVSHGAVVAREYGLPCIVGAKGATKLFKTGDVVILSGRGGVVKLVSR